MQILSTSDAALEREVFWERYKTEVMAVLIVALLAVAGYGGYRFYSERRANAAAGPALRRQNGRGFSEGHQRNTRLARGRVRLSVARRCSEEPRKSSAKRTPPSRHSSDKYPKHELAGTARLAMAEIWKR